MVYAAPTFTSKCTFELNFPYIILMSIRCIGIQFLFRHNDVAICVLHNKLSIE